MLKWLKESFKLPYMEIKALKIAYTERAEIKTSKKKLAFIMLAANYDNLGDIAITRAQEEYLKQILPADYEVVVIPHNKTFNAYLSMKKLINEDTIITLIGGGNSGTLYEFIEWPRRFILKHFSNCKIISFPQSVFYGGGKVELKYKKAFVRLSKHCRKLTLIAREQLSYDRYREMLGDSVRILLVPDIVFTMKAGNEQKRAGACLVFRNDGEKLIGAGTEESIALSCADRYGDVVYADTCNIHVKGTGYAELEQFIDMLKTKELVVTDRLHGMILAYITNTPCIAMDNTNHKVRSTYDTWLRGEGKVRLLEDNKNISSIFFTEDQVILDEKFEPLRKALLEGM